MDSRYGTIVSRWVRGVALSVCANPRLFTLQMAHDVSAINTNLVGLKEFIEIWQT